MSGPTIASLRRKVLRAMRRGPVGPDIGAMSYAERDAHLFGIPLASAGEARSDATPKSDAAEGESAVGAAETPKDRP
jgi:hypothetical protein